MHTDLIFPSHCSHTALYNIVQLATCSPLMKALARNTALKPHPSAVSGVIGTLIIIQAICTLTIHSINANVFSTNMITNCKTRAKRGVRSPCKASLTTMRYTMACPTNHSALEERKNDLECELESQNCTEPTNFQYHCVMNEYANHLVEVCAIATKIVGGVCAEFNEGGTFVQDHYATQVPCSKCPFMYVSTDAFKYQECYNHIQRNSAIASLSTTVEPETEDTSLPTSTSRSMMLQNNNQETSPWILRGIIACISLLLISAVCFMCRRSCRKTKKYVNEQVQEILIRI